MSLIDQHVRDEAIGAIDTSIALAAGAGSGKTTVLTRRVLALLESGVDPSRIATITFTEKATSELLERLRDGLEAARQRDPDNPALDRALSRFGELRVSTIHSFCRSLLTLESLAGRWAPDTDMVDAAESHGPLMATFRTWCRGFDERHPGASVLLRLLVWGETLRGGANALVAFRDLAPHRTEQPLDADRAYQRIQGLHDAFQQALDLCRAPDKDTLVRNNARFAAWLADLAERPPREALSGFLLDFDKGSLQGGAAKNWRPPGKDALKDVVSDARSLREELLGGLHALVVEDLAEHYVPAVEQAKAAAALADHDDLLFRARDLLSGDDGARDRLAAAFDAVLIDEVQDTDPIQAEVAALLARAPGATGPWHASPPRPGHLFAVGDPRQSIYRFRRADVAIWRRLTGMVESGGKALALTQNFRSVPGIVRWVNHTFAELDGYVPQVAARDDGPLPAVVALRLTLPPEHQGARVREAEALCVPLEQEAILRHLRALQDEQVIDRETGQARPFRWSDVMILTPTWRPATELAASLSAAGVPALVEGGRTFFGRPEIQACLAALRALVEPADTDATVSVLRSLFGFTLADLAKHHHAGGSFRYTVAEQPPGAVTRALGVLTGLYRVRGRDSLVALLDSLLDGCRTRAVWALMPDRDARLANLDRLMARLRELEGRSRHPREAVEQLLALEAEGSEDEQALADEDLDAVRLTTVFSAKGREAPVVVLAHNRRSASSVSVARDPDGGRVAVKIGSLAPPDWSTWEQDEKAALQEERQRWMYVACTRARDQLAIPVWPPQARSSKDLTGAWLAGGLVGVRDAEHDETLCIAEGVEVVVRDPDAYPTPVTFDGPFAEHTPAVREAMAQVSDEEPRRDPVGTSWSKAQAARREAGIAASTRWKTVTEVAQEARVEGHAPTGHGIGVEGGALVHQVLEIADLAAPDRLEQAREVLRALTFERGTPEDLVARVEHALERILDNPVFDEIARAPEVWREVPFGIEDGGVQIHGVIDCAYPLDEERRVWRVIDWKSDLPPEGDPTRAVYERQVAVYAKAVLGTVASCQEVRATLVGPHPELGEATLVLEEDGIDAEVGDSV